MVAPEDLPDESSVAAAALLVVEVASPTTRDLDWDRKLPANAQADVEWYWIVDRDAPTIFERGGDGVYVARQRIASGHQAETTGPVTILLDPGRLAR